MRGEQETAVQVLFRRVRDVRRVAVNELAHQAHILTPEDSDNSHYFWATTRGMPPSQEGDAMLRGLLEQAFITEDKPLIEATYRNMQGRDFWAMKPAFLGVDQGGTRARRKLEALLKAELGLKAEAEADG